MSDAPPFLDQALADSLADLRRVMESHQDLLRKPRGDEPQSCPAASTALDVLAMAIQAKTGIKVSPRIQEKIARILASLPGSVVAAWVERMATVPASDPEWMALVESVTVHETFFFRDRRQMAFLRWTILPALLQQRLLDGSRRLRLWSAGCSTGEEAYSLAILALESLAEIGAAHRQADGTLVADPGWQISVVGTDIARPVLSQAEQGLYHDSAGLSPFREMPPEFRSWFETPTDENGMPVAGAHQVKPALRRMVSFRQMNLATDQRPAGEFDLVACRNVMIYLDQATRQRAQQQFAQALTDGGYLILGPTDEVELAECFDSQWGESTVVYIRKAAETCRARLAALPA